MSQGPATCVERVASSAHTSSSTGEVLRSVSEAQSGTGTRREAPRMECRQRDPVRLPPLSAGAHASTPISSLPCPDAGPAGSATYEQALAHARAREYDAGAQAFETLLHREPHHTKAWISYAQMSKKSAGRIGTFAAADAARSVLRRGIVANPESGQLQQAAGLLELEMGDQGAALTHLHRAVALQPSLAPVLRWQAVRDAEAAHAYREHADNQ